VALALAAGGYFLYQRVQDELDKSKPVRVTQYTGIKLANARALVTKDGFEPHVVYEPNGDVEIGTVFKQDPVEGTNLGRGSPVTLTVSTGKPKATVPGVVGKTLADAVAELTDANLDANPQEVPSSEPAGTVVAQDPKAGTVLVEGSRVRINVSKGPKQVFLPSVVGISYDQASAQLQAAGFAVRRVDVDSDKPADEVVEQSPAGNGLVPDHASVTLRVSKGPATTVVQDVINLDSATAQKTLEEQGFTVKLVFTDTTDPTQDDHVISQEPAGGTDAKPNAKITITVGRFTDQQQPPDTTTVPTAPPGGDTPGQ
jgi:serine/threonine-protein kinase